MRKPTQAEIKALLNYDPDTGVFTRIASTSSKAMAGSIAGTFNKTLMYRFIMIDYKLYREHRLAWLYMTGEWPDGEIDHINHIRNDNRWDNLRCVTAKENRKNQSIRSDNTSGVTGVYWHKRRGKWRSIITVDGNQIHLGWYKDKSDAVAARKLSEVEHGFHPNHGGIN